jgi:hypothetical protein
MAPIVQRAAAETPCGDHRCQHPAGQHVDMRIGTHGRHGFWGGCKVRGCLCLEWKATAPCSGREPTTIRSPGGTVYERCACGLTKVVG